MIRECFELLADKKDYFINRGSSNEDPSHISSRTHVLSSIFVPSMWLSLPNSLSGHYGTRTSTVILIRKDTSGVLIERNFGPSYGHQIETPLTHHFGPFQ